MPKRKSGKDSDGDEEEFVSDQEEEKQKTKSKDKKKKAAKAASKTADSEDESGRIELGKNKCVDVREFKGMTLIDIREYYEDKASGEMRPGKKGISLQKAQWEALKEHMDAVDAKITDLQ